MRNSRLSFRVEPWTQCDSASNISEVMSLTQIDVNRCEL